MAEGEGVSASWLYRGRLYPVGSLNVYLTGVTKRDRVLACILRGTRGIGHESGRSIVGGTSVVWGFDGDQFDKFVKCYTDDLPFFHIDHAYFKRGYEHGNFRLNFRHWHQTNVFYGLPADRTTPWRKRFMPWKTDGKKVVIVTPSPKICQMLGWQTGVHKHPKDWAREMEAKVKQHTDRPVYVKEKGEGFLGCIQDAWAVVSLSSVAEVEAVMFGVPVFVSRDSPANGVGLSLSQLDRIERPEYPDREDWFRTLSYSQYNKEEMASGKAWGILRELYGDHDIRRIADGGGELDAPQRPDEHHS